MKKIILTISAFVMIANICNAQEEYTTDLRTRLSFGGKVGFNLSNVYDSEGEDFNAKTKAGLAAGAFLSIPIGTYFGIQPEIMFSQRGFKGTGRILGGNYEFTRTTNYVDIPLLVAFKPGEFFTIVAGPQYSYLMQQKDSFKSGAVTIEQQTEFQNDNIRRNMFCFTAGIDFTMKHFVLGTRAGFDMLKNNGDGTSSTPRYKSVWFQATLGYRFYKS